MEIKNLSGTPLNVIIDCLLAAFADYFVKMPADLPYWENRFKGARVDLGLSYGLFDGGKLAGFIIHGIDRLNGRWTAFNTGTGVIPGYRGQRVVDQLYAQALPELKVRGIQKCALEVIQKNEKAIRVYERIGFRIERGLKCFKGDLPPSANVDITEVDFNEIARAEHPNRRFYAWDNTDEAVCAAGEIYRSFLVAHEGREIGFFVINPRIGYVPQVELLPGVSADHWLNLLGGVAQVSSGIRINNVDESRHGLIEALGKAGLENHIDQYEMGLAVG